jgi:hypothetical protein
MLMAGLAACSCPKPETANPPDLTPEEKTQVSAARDYLAGAEKTGTWSDDDDVKYSATIAALPHEARVQLAKDLVSRLNDRKIKVVHKPRGTGPRVCPGFCPARVTTTTTTTQTQPANPDVPGKVVPAPAVPGKVAPTPAAPNKPAATPAVGKVPAK